MASTWEETKRRQDLVDVTFARLVDLLEAMVDNDSGLARPEKWDEEYAGHAIYNVIDRLICAPSGGMPKPSEDLRERWHEVYERAKGFLFSDYPLPGEVENLSVELLDFASMEVVEQPEQSRALLEQAERVVRRANSLPEEDRIAIAERLGAPEGSLLDASFSCRKGEGGAPLISIDAKMRTREASDQAEAVQRGA